MKAYCAICCRPHRNMRDKEICYYNNELTWKLDGNEKGTRGWYINFGKMAIAGIDFR